MDIFDGKGGWGSHFTLNQHMGFVIKSINPISEIIRM
jgi:hypothetical protein